MKGWLAHSPIEASLPREGTPSGQEYKSQGYCEEQPDEIRVGLTVEVGSGSGMRLDTSKPHHHCGIGIAERA